MRKKIKNFCHLPFYFILVINASSCDTTEPDTNGELILIVEDVSCTEEWIKITAKNAMLPGELKIYRDGEEKINISLTSSDTLIYEDSLIPGKQHEYQAKLVTLKETINGGKTISTTMDTTSRNFTWQTFTFGGEKGSSTLNDVAIIEEKKC